jgi:hypothetical protein
VLFFGNFASFAKLIKEYRSGALAAGSRNSKIDGFISSMILFALIVLNLILGTPIVGFVFGFQDLFNMHSRSFKKRRGVLISIAFLGDQNRTRTHLTLNAKSDNSLETPKKTTTTTTTTRQQERRIGARPPLRYEKGSAEVGRIAPLVYLSVCLVSIFLRFSLAPAPAFLVLHYFSFGSLAFSC